MIKTTGQKIFHNSPRSLALFFLGLIAIQLSACGGSGGGGDGGDTVAPTAVMEVSDVSGRPLAGNRIAYGQNFILSGKRSSDTGGNIVSYEWTSAAGTTVTSTSNLTINAAKNPLPLGMHTYRLVVVDNSGNKSQAAGVDVIVVDIVAPTAVLDVTDASGRLLTGNSIEYGQSFILSGKRSSDTGGGNIVSYEWTSASGTTVTSTDRLTINAASNPLPPGIYSYRLAVLDNSGNKSQPAEIQVTVRDTTPSDTEAPTAALDVTDITGQPLAGNRIAYAQDFILSGKRSVDTGGGSIVSYEWTSTSGTTATSTDNLTINAASNPLPVGSHTYQLTVIDDSGNRSQPTEIQVIVVDIVAPTAVLDATDVTGKPLTGNSVDYAQDFILSGKHSVDTGGGNIVSYEWTSASGTTVTSTDSLTINAAGNPLPAGIHTYRLVVVDNSGNRSQPAEIQMVMQAQLSCNTPLKVDSASDAPDASPGDMLCDDGSGNCTLRAAIEEANACPGHGQIELPSDTYVLTLGGLTITDGVTITGAGAKTTIIDGNNSSRIFTVATGLDAIDISDLTIRNGKETYGGGLRSSGNTPVTIRRAIISDNWGTNSGGAFILGVDSNLTLEDSTISGNHSGNSPGGSALVFDTGTRLVIRSSTIINNRVDSSTGSGAGVILDWSHGGVPTVIIENSTISGNNGVAILAYKSAVTINNTTITNNDTGLYAGSGNGTSNISISNTILYGNGANCATNGGILASDGHNIDSRNTCGFTATGDLVNANPLLGPLSDNGGLTFTRGLRTGSPAIDAGDPATCMATDQRGSARPNGAACDIGAYEDDGTVLTATCLSGSLMVTSSLDVVDANIGDGLCDDGAGNCSLRAAIQEANACVGADVIDLPAGTYPLTLTGLNENLGMKGDLDIHDDLIINGDGAATTVIDASPPFDDRIFHVLNNVSTAFNGMTLQAVNINWDAPGGGIETGGDLSVSNAVISDNVGGNGTGIDAWDKVATVTISDTTMSNNTSSGYGGAIKVEGTLNLSGSTLSGNIADNYGGAIYGNKGALLNIDTSLIDSNGGTWAAVVGMDNSTINIIDSTVSNSVQTANSTRGVTGWSNSTINIVRSSISNNQEGGGITSTGAYNYGGGSVLNITDSTIAGNIGTAVGSFSFNGAGIFSDGTLTVTGSTISGNQIKNTLSGNGNGAGIFMDGSGTITNSTISGNNNGGNAGRGGGIGGSADLIMLNSTVYANTSKYGGGIGLQNGTLVITNSIVAGNSNDCDTTYMLVTSNGNNIESLNSCGFSWPGDLINTDPLLGILGDNGGATWTHALAPLSPAIDAGDDAACPATDQRGVKRPQGVHCDVGAYEMP